MDTQVYPGTIHDPGAEAIDLDSLAFRPVSRTSPDEAVKIGHPFVVFGPLGKREGKAGDYLVRASSDGTIYPHSAEEFDAEYRVADQEVFDHAVVAMEVVDDDGHYLRARLRPQDAIECGQALVAQGQQALAEVQG